MTQLVKNPVEVERSSTHELDHVGRIIGIIPTSTFPCLGFVFRIQSI